jgi:DNA-directed RNA polymerase subunit beta'
LCYGIDPTTGLLVEEGTAVGLLAARTLGESAARLVMRSFLSNEAAEKRSDEREVRRGLARVVELFEARHPRDTARPPEVAGRVRLGGTRGRKQIIWIQAEDEAGQPLPGREYEHPVPEEQDLLVHTGDHVREGDPLVAGPLSPHDLLRIRGQTAAERYLVTEVQAVYRSQGLAIDDRHIEIIVAQMLRYVKVQDAGDTGLQPGTLLDKFDFQAANDRLKTPPRFVPPRLAYCSVRLLGISEVVRAKAGVFPRQKGVKR